MVEPYNGNLYSGRRSSTGKRPRSASGSLPAARTAGDNSRPSPQVPTFSRNSPSLRIAAPWQPRKRPFAFATVDSVSGKELLSRGGFVAKRRSWLSPDGQRLATGHADSTILIWDGVLEKIRPAILSGTRCEGVGSMVVRTRQRGRSCRLDRYLENGGGATASSASASTTSQTCEGFPGRGGGPMDRRSRRQRFCQDASWRQTHWRTWESGSCPRWRKP